MSKSQLYIIDEKFNIKGITEFNNLWLFSPIVWDILYHKYFTSDNDKHKFIIACIENKDMWYLLNEKINAINLQMDNICWKLSQRQLFFSKDKEFIANCIERFFDINKNYFPIKNNAFYRKNLLFVYKKLLIVFVSLTKKQNLISVLKI